MIRIVLIACLLIVGCGPVSSVPGPDKPNQPTVEKVDPAALFKVLADFLPTSSDDIAATIPDLKTLQRAVKIHLERDWTDSIEMAAFDKAFNGPNRQLTPADAATLRGLK
jgi:hypothetical protein